MFGIHGMDVEHGGVFNVLSNNFRMLKTFTGTEREKNFWGNVTQVAGHLDFYGCLGAKGGAIYINEGHMILQGGSQARGGNTQQVGSRQSGHHPNFG